MKAALEHSYRAYREAGHDVRASIRRAAMDVGVSPQEAARLLGFEGLKGL